MWLTSLIVLTIPLILDPSPEPSPFPTIYKYEDSIYRYEDRVNAAKYILKENDPSIATMLQFTDKQIDRILGRKSDIWIVSG